MSDLEHSTEGRLVPGRPAHRELEVTWGRAVRVWWAVTWRAIGLGMLVGGLSGCAIGFVVGMVGHASHADQATVNTIITMITIPTGLVLGVVVSIWTTRAVLEKQFREFRIALIAR